MGEENERRHSRRMVMTTTLGSAAGLVVAGTVGSPASAAERRRGGVAKVLRKPATNKLVVKFRDNGATMRVRARHFGGSGIRRGDLVAIVPDPDKKYGSGERVLIAQPFVDVDAETGAVTTPDAAGGSRRIGTHS